MSTKLTLTVNKEVIDKAKTYAKNEGRSLSNLVEDYLKSLVSEPQVEYELTPVVKSLKGAIKTDDLKVDYESVLEEELAKKYLRTK